MDEATDYLDIAGIAAELTRLGIPTSQQQAYRIAAKHGFPAIRLRKKIYARRRALHDWLLDREHGPG